MNIGCSICNWNDCSCDIHHIKHVKDGGDDSHKNLTYICPNCHRKAHNGQITEFINIDEYIGDEWKKYYNNLHRQITAVDCKSTL